MCIVTHEHETSFAESAAFERSRSLRIHYGEEEEQWRVHLTI
jgi:hypothetical protein